MKMQWLELSCVMGLICAVPACDPAGEDHEVDDRSDVYTCPRWKCGFNSAEINGRAIRELNLDGASNSAGMRIVGFVPPPGRLGSWSLDVAGDALIARSGGTTLRGAQLVGAQILVRDPSLSGLPVPVIIAGYEEIPSWAAGAPDVATYALVYADVNALLGVKNVCVGDITDALTSAATVLGGETYDLATKTVKPSPRWLTIACAGSAAAKMRLMNYGPQSNFDGTGAPASVAQRQATLKMITADYCGTGQSHTQNGTRLYWENASGTVVSGGAPGQVEAVWTQAGALCLGATRIADVTPACARPSCAGLSLDQGEWITHVPPP